MCSRCFISACGCHRRHPLRPETCWISLSTRSPSQLARPVVAAARLPVVVWRLSRCLGRECELVRVCVCLFDPVVNEEHESSSTCSPELRRPVETRTPPFGRAESKPSPRDCKQGTNILLFNSWSLVRIAERKRASTTNAGARGSQGHKVTLTSVLDCG